jgi:hypothetical protein
MISLCHWISKLIQYFLETCLCLFCIVLLKRRISINVKQFYLFINIIHSFLKITLLSISRKIQRLKWWKGSHKFLISHHLLTLTSNFSTNSLKLFPRKLNSIRLSKINKCNDIYMPYMVSINLIDHMIKLKTI